MCSLLFQDQFMIGRRIDDIIKVGLRDICNLVPLLKPQPPEKLVSPCLLFC